MVGREGLAMTYAVVRGVGDCTYKYSYHLVRGLVVWSWLVWRGWKRALCRESEKAGRAEQTSAITALVAVLAVEGGGVLFWGAENIVKSRSAMVSSTDR